MFQTSQTHPHHQLRSGSIPPHLESSLITKTTSPSAVGSRSRPLPTSASLASNYRLEIDATMIPYIPADIETSGNDPGPSTPPARVLPEHVLSSDNYNHDNSDSAHSRFSATDALVNGDTESNSTSPSPQSLYLKFEALKTTLGKRARAHAPADWSVGPASSTRAAVVPAKKRVRSRGLMRSAPRATVAATPSTLAGNSEFMYVYTSSFLPNIPS